MNIQDFLFGNPVFKVLERNLDVQAKRLESASANLANMDTPGYKSVQVDFEQALNTEITRVNPEIQLATDPRHFGATAESQQARPITIREVDDKSFRVDGNNVDSDKELMTIGQASGAYSASVVGLQRKFALLAAAIESKV